MADSITGQVEASAAEVYEEFFLPALFNAWPPLLAEAARVRTGSHVLDVACGTGVCARAIARIVGPSGRVLGIDRNDGMLAVARRNAPGIEWRNALAESLPVDTSGMDAVVCQFGLMFFENKPAAIREMMRVLRPGGRLAVAVWDTLENTPGYNAVTEILLRLFGDEAADAMRAPYSLGDLRTLRSLFLTAGIPDITVETHRRPIRFPSIAAWVHTDIKGWTLSDMISDEQFGQLLAAAERDLRPFTTSDGAVMFDGPAHIVTVLRS